MWTKGTLSPGSDHNLKGALSLVVSSGHMFSPFCSPFPFSHLVTPPFLYPARSALVSFQPHCFFLLQLSEFCDHLKTAADLGEEDDDDDPEDGDEINERSLKT